LPGAGQDYSLIFAGCDNGLQNTSPTGLYGYIRHIAEIGDRPLAAIVHSDDVVYAHGEPIDDSGYTGHQSMGDPVVTLREYDYAIRYAAVLGLLGNPMISQNAHGHSADRQWCYRNVPRWVQWGDHEFDNNNIGWSTRTADRNCWVPARNVWDGVFGPLMPPRLAATTNHSEGQHYGVSLGDLYVVGMDRVTMGQGGGVDGTVLFGDTQIDEVLAAMDGPEPFKILSLTNSIRYLDDPLDPATVGTSFFGANEPLADHRAAEWTRLMTAASTGLQARANIGGWKFCTIHGDHHNPSVIRHENNDDLASGGVAESFMQFGTGTINGSTNHIVDPSLVVGATYRGSSLEYFDTFRSDKTRDWSCVQIDIIGSESDKKMCQYTIDGTWSVVYACLYRSSQAGNLPERINLPPPITPVL
jgi:hypothetical protein